MPRTYGYRLREVVGDSIIVDIPQLCAHASIAFKDHELLNKEQIAKSFEPFIGKDGGLEFPDDATGNYRIGLDLWDCGNSEIRAAMSDFTISKVEFL